MAFFETMLSFFPNIKASASSFQCSPQTKAGSYSYQNFKKVSGFHKKKYSSNFLRKCIIFDLESQVASTGKKEIFPSNLK